MDLRADRAALVVVPQNVRRRDQPRPRARRRLGVRYKSAPRRLYVLIHDPPTVDVTHDAHPLSQPPSPAASPPPSPPPRITHQVARGDSLAGVALRYGVSVSALRRANGLWASDSIHLRAALVIPDGREPVPLPKPRRSVEHGHVRTSTELPLPSAADVVSSFSLTLPRLRLSLDPSESDAEHELLPLSLSARRRKSRPQLSMTAAPAPTNKQPSPIRGMVLPRAGE
ncbi:hypothetical protein AURDEDRAFT_117602 [Auricularia subglabra TFB-10046 SS5]|uniref:LysM domain-containing protein n=1 Tax=Auricularia subglabra (strain TFB-10046 / SS5) TaxID=717982 RepID=J0WQ88_AURST|nr:hypothetical protein AURDEDRAFT_117602 [Auricularia subglabra TFB-10046 SS5]